MPRLYLPILLLFILAQGCVPRSDYRTLVTERDGYRDQLRTRDSLAQTDRSTFGDSLLNDTEKVTLSLRRIEDLLATNLLLKERLDASTERYDVLLEEHNRLLPTDNAGYEVRSIEREARLKRREDALKRGEQRLTVRERTLSEQIRKTMPAPSGGQGFDKTSPVAPRTGTHLQAERVADEISQLLKAAYRDTFSVGNPYPGVVSIVLSDSLVYDSDGQVSVRGQQLLRKLTATLRNYRGAEYAVIAHASGHSGGVDGAYRASSSRAVAVAVQLARFGVDPATIVAGAQGLYGIPPGLGRTPVELRITYR